MCVGGGGGGHTLDQHHTRLSRSKNNSVGELESNKSLSHKLRILVCKKLSFCEM